MKIIMCIFLLYIIITVMFRYVSVINLCLCKSLCCNHEQKDRRDKYKIEPIKAALGMCVLTIFWINMQYVFASIGKQIFDVRVNIN